jgi:hypothetical protein
MRPFTKKTPEPPPVTGTRALRNHLKSRIERPSGVTYSKVAVDISDTINEAATKAKARSIAESMALAGDEAAIRSIAASLMGTLDVKTTVVSGQALEDFANSKTDLSAAVKNGLANYLHGGSVIFDESRDLLDSAYRDRKVVAMGRGPDPWSNPDPKIRAAQEALKAAQLEARGPMPLQRLPSTPPSPPKRPPGFA